MSAHGIDMNIVSQNLQGKLGWQTNWIFSYYADKTLDYYIPEGFIFRPQSGKSISPVIGKPMHGISSYNWAGLDATGDPLGYIEHGVSKEYIQIIQGINNSDSLAFAGPGSPRYFGNVNNSFSSRGFTLNVNISVKMGYYFRRPTTDYETLFSTGIFSSDFSDRWKKPGDEQQTNVPSLYYPMPAGRGGFYNNSAITVKKADHIRLEYINLSYELKQGIIHSRKIKSLQLYGNVANLGILWRSNKDRLDPEYPDTTRPGITYAFGIRGSF